MTTTAIRGIVTRALIAFVIVVHSGGLVAHAQTSSVGTNSPDCSCQPSAGLDWNSCGFLPFAGYEGWANQSGRFWCDEGVPSSLVEDQYTTAYAAKKELQDILAGRPSHGHPLLILRVTEHGPAYLLELTEPVPVIESQSARFGWIVKGASFGWVVKWAEDRSIHSAYGCSREAALRLYQRQCESALPMAVPTTAPN